MKNWWVGIAPFFINQRGEDRGKRWSWEVRYLVKIIKGLISQYYLLLTMIWFPSKYWSALWHGKWNPYWSSDKMTDNLLEIFFQFLIFWSFGNDNLQRCMSAKKPVTSMDRKRRLLCCMDDSRSVVTFLRSSNVNMHFLLVGELFRQRQPSSVHLMSGEWHAGQTLGKWGSSCWQMPDRYDFTEQGSMWWDMKTV